MALEDMGQDAPLLPVDHLPIVALLLKFQEHVEGGQVDTGDNKVKKIRFKLEINFKIVADQAQSNHAWV